MAATATQITATATELDYNAGVTPGTKTASKTLVVDANGNIDNVTIGKSATPSLDIIDTDCGDGDVGARIKANASDAGSGTEDVDVGFFQQINGVLTEFLSADADGIISVGRDFGVPVNSKIHLDNGQEYIYSDGSDMWFGIAGGNKWKMTASAITDGLTRGASIQRGTSTYTNPVYTNGSNNGDGIGFGANNSTSVIANSIEGLRVAEDSSIAAIHIPEITTPTAIADFGAVYAKADNKLYFQDGAGVEHEVAFV